MGIFDSIGNFVQNDIVKPVENVGTGIANVWNQQPGWLKGVDIAALTAAAAAATGGLSLGAEGAAGAGGIDALASIGPGVTEAGGAIGGDAAGAAAALTADASPLLGDPSQLAITQALGGADAGGGGIISDPAAFMQAAPGFSPTGGGVPGGGLAQGAFLNNAGDVSDLSTSGLNLGDAGAPSTSGIPDWLSKNKNLLSLLGLGIGGELLGPGVSNALGLNKVPGSGPLNQNAAQLGTLAGQQQQFGTTLEAPITTGVLPPGVEASVTNALHDAIQSVKSRYANLGLTGSTMEADAIANLQNQTTAMRGTLETQMAQTGLSAMSQAATDLGLQDQIYSQLMQAQIAQDSALGGAIAKFAASAGAGAALKGATLA